MVKKVSAHKKGASNAHNKGVPTLKKIKDLIENYNFINFKK